MNTYMYAPKDDCKHRAFWRDLYSVEEAGNYPYQRQLIFSLHYFLEKIFEKCIKIYRMCINSDCIYKIWKLQ